jgi:hypothetical protein
MKFNNIISEQKLDCFEKYPEGYFWVSIPDATKYQRVYGLTAKTWCGGPEVQNLSIIMYHTKSYQMISEVLSSL